MQVDDEPVYKSEFPVSGGAATVNGTTKSWNGTAFVNDAGFIWTMDFQSALTLDQIIAPYDMSIDSQTNLVNAPTLTILVNAAAYTLGVTINAGDTIDVSASVNGVSNLNCSLK